MGTEVAIISAIIAVGGAIYANNQIPDDPQDIGADITKQGSQASRNRIYGRCRATCSNVWSNVNNFDNSKRVDVFSIAGIGKLKKIHQCFINDKKVFDPIDIDYVVPDDGISTDGVFGHDAEKDILGQPLSGIQLSDNFRKQKVSLQVRMGYAQETAMSLPIQYGDGEWTIDHRGDGVPQIAVVAERNVKDEGIVIVGDRYNIIVEVTGDDVEDINGLPVDSKNSAYALLDYLTNKEYGLAIPREYIDLQSFAEAAAFVDSHELYVNAEMKTENPFADGILNLLSCFGGSLTINNGMITVLYEDVSIAEYSFDRDNILKDSLSVRPASSQNYYNSVTTTYKSGPNKEGEDDFMLPADIINHPDYIDDQEILNKTIKMPFTIDGRLDENDKVVVEGPVKFLTNREYRKRLFQKTCTFDVDLMDYPNLQIWSVVDITEPLYEWDKKPFRVLEINSSVDSEQFNIATITLSEYDDSIYTGEEDGGAGDPPSEGTDPTPPANVAFTQQAYVADGFGTLSWNATFFSISAEYDVQYKLSSENSWTTVGRTSNEEMKISNLKPANYDFRVRVNDYIRGTSNWATITEQTIEPPQDLPQVKNLAADFTTRTVFCTWDSILDEPLGGTDSNDPNSGGSTGTVKDVFSHYLVNISESTTVHGSGYSFVKGYIVTEPKFDYTFDDNSKNGTGPSRYVRVEVTVVSKTGATSPITSVNTQNTQMPQPSGVSVTGEFAQMFLSWDAPTENDYYKTLIYASETTGFTPSESNKIGEVSGGSHFNYLFTQDDPNVPQTYYVKFVHRDVFNPINGLLYSPQQTFITQSIDSLLPEFPSELEDIRDPNREQTSTGEVIMNVASANKRVVTGYGMYAKDSGDSAFIIAANEFVIASGGYANWDASITYQAGDKVSFKVDDFTQSTWEALRTTTGDSPPTSPSDWDQILANSFQSAFYIDSESEQLLIRNATIQDLNASQITAGTLGAGVIYGGIIQGGQISSSSTIVAGSGANVAGFDGADANLRIYAGSSYTDRATAPFRVDKDGKLFSNNAEIEGKVTMTSGGVAGWNIDAQNIYSGASPQTSNAYDTDGITLSSDGGIRSRFFRVDTNGNAYFSGNISGSFGTFSGNIQAGQILGDIVTAINKTTTTIGNVTAVGDSSDIVTFSVVNARNYDRTFVVNGLKLNVFKPITPADKGSHVELIIRSSDAGVSDVIADSIVENTDVGGEYTIDNITIEVPANTAPNLNVFLRVVSMTGTAPNSDSWSAPVVESMGLLFTTGGDLS